MKIILYDKYEKYFNIKLRYTFHIEVLENNLNWSSLWMLEIAFPVTTLPNY